MNVHQGGAEKQHIGKFPRRQKGEITDSVLKVELQDMQLHTSFTAVTIQYNLSLI